MNYIKIQQMRKQAAEAGPNAIPASHYESRVPEAKTRAYLGLKPGSDRAFWRNYYAGQSGKQNYELSNALANAANTPGDHQRWYQTQFNEPPFDAIRSFAEKSYDGKLPLLVPTYDYKAALKKKPAGITTGTQLQRNQK